MALRNTLAHGHEGILLQQGQLKPPPSLSSIATQVSQPQAAHGAAASFAGAFTPIKNIFLLLRKCFAILSKTLGNVLKFPICIQVNGASGIQRSKSLNFKKIQDVVGCARGYTRLTISKDIPFSLY